MKYFTLALITLGFLLSNTSFAACKLRYELRLNEKEKNIVSKKFELSDGHADYEMQMSTDCKWYDLSWNVFSGYRSIKSGCKTQVSISNIKTGKDVVFVETKQDRKIKQSVLAALRKIPNCFRGEIQ